MTNSYNLSLRPRIVFIHGMNNHDKCFNRMDSFFRNNGFETDLIILPCHGENRKEARDFKDALSLFDQKMKALGETPYVAIAFSHGALYLQLWLEKNPKHKPLKQVLLAPALYIRKQNVIEKALKLLPDWFIIKSFSPKEFRRYELLSVWEYKILIHGAQTFQKFKGPFKVPSLVYIDPKDELVDAKKLKDEIEKKNDNFKVQYFERPYLKRPIGCHHILFHPNYFQKNDWSMFMSSIEDYLVR